MDEPRNLRTMLEQDHVPLGAKVTTTSPAIIETFGKIDLDYAWVDLEHTGPSPENAKALEKLIRAAEVGEIDLLVRVPSADTHIIRKVLDAGVRSILVPRVTTAEEIRSAVRATRFKYDSQPGDRGVGLGRSSHYGTDFDDYISHEDNKVTLGVMIENKTAIDNLSNILSVPNLGFIFLGPADLSVSLGYPLDTDHPEVVESINRIQETAKEFDVPVGCIAEDPEVAKQVIEEGHDMLRIGGDVSAATTVIRNRIHAIRNE